MDPFTKTINEAYFNAVILEAFMRGIHLVIFITALFKIWTRPKHIGGPRVGMTVVVVLLFVLATADLGSFWAYVGQAFIAHGDTAETIAGALNEYPTWRTAMMTFSNANPILADIVIIWRTWVIWERNWKITILPIISTVLVFAFSFIAIYQTVTNTTFGILGVDYTTAFYSTTIVTTVFCTGAIVYRVIRIGGYKSYRSIIEILVSSALLYCFATIFALVSYIYSGPASEYASAFWTASIGIAPTLVVARAADGQAGPKQTWPWDSDAGGWSSENPLGSLRFSHGTRNSGQIHDNASLDTRAFDDHDSDTITDPCVGLNHEVDKTKEAV